MNVSLMRMLLIILAMNLFVYLISKLIGRFGVSQKNLHVYVLLANAPIALMVFNQPAINYEDVALYLTSTFGLVMLSKTIIKSMKEV